MGLIIRQKEPNNLETPFDQVDAFLTPWELFYIRSHFPAPKLDLASYQLRIDGRESVFSELQGIARQCPPRRGSPFWSARAMVASSLSHRLKERSGGSARSAMRNGPVCRSRAAYFVWVSAGRTERSRETLGSKGRRVPVVQPEPGPPCLPPTITHNPWPRSH